MSDELRQTQLRTGTLDQLQRGLEAMSKSTSNNGAPKATNHTPNNTRGVNLHGRTRRADGKFSDALKLLDYFEDDPNL